MNDPHNEHEPKLIIDEDWKSQVQREKDELAAKQHQEHASDADDAASASDMPAPPPASLEMLVTMLASQAVMAMGQMPNPVTGEMETDIDYARHYIDTISMLEEKTQGNLSADEQAMLTQTVHQLRMLFVSACKKHK